MTEILEAFEEYKERTGTAPEKVQELKHGTLRRYCFLYSVFFRSLVPSFFFRSLVSSMFTVQTACFQISSN